MGSTAAIIVHEVMDVPESFKEKSKGIITNGYYSVSIDGMKYGMGASMYNADGAEMAMLMKAVAEWKAETGWQPHDEAEPETPKPAPNPLPDGVAYREMERFIRSVRSRVRTFGVHGEARVLVAGIADDISKLDQILYPVQKIEGKRNADGGGV